MRRAQAGGGRVAAPSHAIHHTVQCTRPYGKYCNEVVSAAGGHEKLLLLILIKFFFFVWAVGFGKPRPSPARRALASQPTHPMGAAGAVGVSFTDTDNCASSVSVHQEAIPPL
jgi:hypothetical protein